MNDFRFNEVQLLKAGLPKSFVEALRALSVTVGRGINIADVGELEALLLAQSQTRGENTNLAQAVQMLTDQVGALRRQQASDAQAIQQRLDALQANSKPNLSALEQRLADLEHYLHGVR